MIGSVRAKMYGGGAMERGEKGAQMWLNVVYEGNQELQKISENAIFGDATPSGGLTLYGDFPVERFKLGYQHEYYVDIYPEGTVPAGDYLVIFNARLQYQSKPTPPNTNVSFRFVPLGDVSGSLDLGIHNSAAIEWLSEHDNVVVVLRDVSGRKSDAEISIREKMLAEMEESAGKNWDTYHPKGYYQDQTREQHIHSQTHAYRVKLARARGEAVN